MNPLRPATDVRPLSDFRANAAALIRQVRQTRRPLVLTQRGHGTAVVLGAADYERLLEEIDLLRDVATAEAELAAGGGLPHADARAQALARVRR